MYKILIVDDESMVIHGLCKQIDWQSYSLELAGTAETGEKALAIIENKSIDILFTDVCMPKMDGLTLIALAKQHSPFLRSVVISSHSEFGYVKKALLLGVENYLLKPINQEELERTLEKTIENLNRDRIGFIKDGVDSSAFRNNILDRWVNASIQDYEFYERAEVLQINIHARQYNVCVIEVVHAESEDQKQKYVQILIEICRNRFNDYYDGETNIEIFIDRFTRITIVLYGDELSKMTEKLTLFLNEISAGAIDSGIHVFSSIGGISEGVGNVAHNYSIAVEYLNCRLIDMNSGPIFCVEFLRPFNLLGCGPSLVQLTNALIDEEYDHANRILKKFLNICSSASLENAKKCMIPFLVMIVKRMNESGRMSEMLPAAVTAEFAMINSISDMEGLSKWFLGIMNQSFEVMGKRKNSLHLLVQRTVDTIRKDFHTDLSLKTIAITFKVSPAYLGKLFKEETGKYFNDYLAEVRLQTSRVFLLETDLKIREILYRIGMSNQSYYNRIFKKAYGMSPLDFRRQKYQHNANR